MKKILSAIFAFLMLTNTLAFTAGAQTVNEPTTQELEAIIKLVKPKLDVPEECSEFTWRFTAKTAYREASWRLTWQTGDNAESYSRVYVTCDTAGNIISYSYNSDGRVYGQLPSYTKDELKNTADAFIEKTIPEVSENVKLESASASGIYSGQYNYRYVRHIDGNVFPDNYVNVSVDYTTGKVTQMSAEYDYELIIHRHDNVISPERAAEILGTRQKMNLKYLTRLETDETTKQRTVKAFLVYVPELSYIAVDAGTGEIYDTKSSWQVVGGAGGALNGTVMDKAEEESAAPGSDYELTDEEKAGVAELAGLISKEEAIKKVTENPYLYIDKSLTAVTARLSKNYSAEKTSAYQNGNGSYIWSISFSNPVIENKYYSNAYARASVNAETGELISYSCNLNDYYYYAESKLDIPDIKLSSEQAREAAEEFLGVYAAEKLANSEKYKDYATNMISCAGHIESMKETIYGAHVFSYRRVNEGVPFDRNTINVGVDCVTGKIFSFSSNWWTNVEFESPKGAITPDKALECLLTYDGYGLVYERNITYLYTPVTESSKKDVSAAFAASLVTTMENGGDIDPVIKKYAKDIDRDKLTSLLAAGDEAALFDFIASYFGVSAGDVIETASSYVDTSLFYNRSVEARLVYTCYNMATSYVSPFTGKQLGYNGDEYKETSDDYTYDDIAGHWVEANAKLLADVGIGFEGGSFEPERIITAKEFAKLSQAMGLYNTVGEEQTELDRISAVRAILNSMGYEKVASLQGIYRTEFEDNDEIKQEDIGYTAIGFGLGILKGDGRNARIYEKLTRAQAVSLLVNALKAAK